MNESNLTKICNSCHEEKALDLFYWENKSKNRKAKRCKTCQSRLSQNHYKKNKSSYIKSRRNFRQRRRDLLKKLKASPCSVCGKKFPYYCMEFDHIDPAKKRQPVSSIYSINPMLKEIEKCRLVCILCHRNISYEQSLLLRTESINPQKDRFNKSTQIVILAKSHPCARCNNIFNHWQMDFDHLRGEEKFKDIARMRAQGYSEDALLKEIAKCQLLCALCHRITTMERKTKKSNLSD